MTRARFSSLAEYGEDVAARWWKARRAELRAAPGSPERARLEARALRLRALCRVCLDRVEGGEDLPTPSLDRLPRVKSVICSYPRCLVKLESGAFLDLYTMPRRALLPHISPHAGLLLADWKDSNAGAYVVPASLLPALAPAFPKRGEAARLEVTADAVMVETTEGKLYTFARPLWYSVGQSLEGDGPDTLTLKDAAGFPIAFFDLPAGTPGAAHFRRGTVEA